MTRQEWFGLGVRLLGLWHLAYAGQYMATAMDVQFDLLPDSYDKRLGENPSGKGYFFYSIAYAGMGLWFLRGAEAWTRFAYPLPSEGDEMENGVQAEIE